MAILPLAFPVDRPDDFNFTTRILIPNAFRAATHLIAFLILMVPSRLLVRNRELGASIFTINIMLVNLFLFVQFLIWHTEDLSEWWIGEYYCDFAVYTFAGSLVESIDVTAILVIIRHLAITVGDLRASPLTVKEKRYRNFTELMIIVPWALSTIPLHYLTNRARYAIMPTIGCTYVSDESWVNAVFLTVVPLVFIGAGVYFAILTFLRFREVEKTAVVLRTRSSANSVRAHRTRRRMYGLALTIAIPYFIVNVVGMSAYITGLKFGPYSFNDNRGPLYNTAILLPAWGLTWLDDMWYWSWSVQAIPVFWFFGLTKDAVNMYRVGCLALGLGRFFPGLHEEYDPDRMRDPRGPRTGGSSSGNDDGGSPKSWRSRVTSAIKNHLFDISENNEELSPDWRLPKLPTLTTFNPFATTVSRSDKDKTLSSIIDSDLEKGTMAGTIMTSSKQDGAATASATATTASDTASFRPVVSGTLPTSSSSYNRNNNVIPTEEEDARPYGPYRSTPGPFSLMLFRNLRLPFRSRKSNKSKSKANSNSIEGTGISGSSSGRIASTKSDKISGGMTLIGTSSNRTAGAATTTTTTTTNKKTGPPPSSSRTGGLGDLSGPVATRMTALAASTLADAPRKGELLEKEKKPQKAAGSSAAWYDDLTILDDDDDDDDDEVYVDAPAASAGPSWGTAAGSPANGPASESIPAQPAREEHGPGMGYDVKNNNAGGKRQAD